MATKFRNVRTVTTDGAFDSRAELRRWQELQLAQRAGVIRDLRRQVAFELAPSVKYPGASRATPSLRYLADFVYEDVERGGTVIEDVKGLKDGKAYVEPVYRVKKHLMKALLGLDIVEVQPRKG